MIFCDYNASAPLSPGLRGVDFFEIPFANPSSQNLLGKKSLKLVDEVSGYLKSVFNLPDHHCVYHSGATEGANLFILGILRTKISQHKKCKFIYSNYDHSCIKEQVPELKALGVDCVEVKFSVEDKYDLNKFKKEILKDCFCLLSLTSVHGETGRVFDFSGISEIISENLFIHLDATQSIGKTESFLELDQGIDAISFSAHKFGALKGIGWSFVKEVSLQNLDIRPLFFGGGQQKKMRPSTINTHGIYSLKIALEHLVQNFDSLRPIMIKNIEILRELSSELIKDGNCLGHFSYSNNHLYNLNTVFFVFERIKTELLLPFMDLRDIYIGTGAACTSGVFNTSSYLESLGLGEYSNRTLRISLSPYETTQNSTVIREMILEAISKL